MCGVISLTGNDLILGHLTVAGLVFLNEELLIVDNASLFHSVLSSTIGTLAKYFRHTYFANFLHANCCCRRHNNLRNVEQ